MTAAASPSNNLGISAKSIHMRRIPALAHGLVARFSAQEQAAASLAAKRRRYELQRTAQAIVYSRAHGPSQQSRVCWCQRVVVNGEFVAVYRAADRDNARMAGLNTCGSVWDCPVCGAKITEARRIELSKAVAAWIKRRGGRINLLTLTFPHEADHPLAELIERQTKARQRFANCRTWKRIMAAAGSAGQVRSLETTVGPNGWHPHTHDLLFLDREITPAETAELRAEWVRILVKVGLGSNIQEMMAHALDLRDGAYAAEYVAKFGRDSAWGASAELTRPHAKVGREQVAGESHLTPFQLLAWESAEPGCIVFMKGRRDSEQPMARDLFREFSAAFKGKRMLSWSRGLRATLGALVEELREEATDEELAAMDRPMPDEVRIGEIKPDALGLLLRSNKMGEFLEYAATCADSQQDLDDYVAAVASAPIEFGSRYRLRNTMRLAGSAVSDFVECE